MSDPTAVLRYLADIPSVMGVVDGWPIQHVTAHISDGPDARTDTCPCDRTWTAESLATLTDHERALLDLGGGQRVSSPTHTVGDLIRDITGG
jgi:hypothetical protein